MNQPPLARALLGELIGTYLLVGLGTSVVATAVLTDAYSGLWQVAILWGVVVTLAIYASATLSGAHINPAVSLAFALHRRSVFPLSRLGPYIGAQLLGGVLGGFSTALFFGPFLLRFEQAEGIVRGLPGSERSAMILSDYFPNPAMFGTDEAARALVSPLHAASVEAFGTAILVFVVFALTSSANAAAPSRNIAPLFVGLTVALLIGIFAPITMACWNPARDLGPRVVALLLGWGPIAFPGPEGGFWVYILGPLSGGAVGGWVARLVGFGEQ